MSESLVAVSSFTSLMRNYWRWALLLLWRPLVPWNCSGVVCIDIWLYKYGWFAHVLRGFSRAVLICSFDFLLWFLRFFIWLIWSSFLLFIFWLNIYLSSYLSPRLLKSIWLFDLYCFTGTLLPSYLYSKHPLPLSRSLWMKFMTDQGMSYNLFVISRLSLILKVLVQSWQR
jgi:glycosyltransferase involved in cell wall biosynthesis